MKIYIKYMVSQRCKMLVTSELLKLGVINFKVNLGIVDILEDFKPQQMKLLRERLKFTGLEILDDKRSILVEKIKIVVIEMIHYDEDGPREVFSSYISSKLGYDYTYMSNVFSEVRGITIQNFIILNKVERIKELLLYDELSLSEISYQMNYSSPAHLSNQFKRITGLTPSYFKHVKRKRLANLENI